MRSMTEYSFGVQDFFLSPRQLVDYLQILGSQFDLELWYVQVQKFRRFLRIKEFADIRVGTVDNLQGQAKRVIFISVFCHSRKYQKLAYASDKPWEREGQKNPEVGFWRNLRRSMWLWQEQKLHWWWCDIRTFLLRWVWIVLYCMHL